MNGHIYQVKSKKVYKIQEIEVLSIYELIYLSPTRYNCFKDKF
ncbi:hypothetical protein C789_228 [Microcystis aeruginosa FACHB-905 = DIANCHI905]|uniref:Uncharacterized protein n=1 Tax=Microcystis aeruginosa PCC 7806SL TaxID=1903187 RepID=A0AB33BWK5_MICA7|nr:hypothetical protein BH695_4973 [Microcystis aeruginosa PCC 7806SL]ELS49977.1 hypothetical protein C789_228 [Microcystis aeruginosa FACHB-905 = DIANCHI905]